MQNFKLNFKIYTMTSDLISWEKEFRDALKGIKTNVTFEESANRLR